MKHAEQLSIEALLENAPVGIVIHRWDSTIAYANPMASRLLESASLDLVDRDATSGVWPLVDDAGRALPAENYPVNRVRATGKSIENTLLGIRSAIDGDITWVLVNAYLEDAQRPEDSFIVVSFSDVSESKRAFSFEAIVENARDMVIVTDASAIEYPVGPKIVYVNNAFEDITGYKREQAIGETPRLLQGKLTDRAAKGRIRAALRKGEEVGETLLNYDADGKPYWIQLNIIPLRNKHGEVTHFASIERDISALILQEEQLKKRNRDLKVFKSKLEGIIEERTRELQDAKAQLEKIAFVDPLTDLPNRRLFADQANRLWNSCARRNELLAFGLFDIDNFKTLNDTYGHDVGDRVLAELGALMKKLFRAEDAFCRYGGEEFAFVVAIKTPSDAVSMAERLLEAIRCLEVPMEHADPLRITVSMGLKVTVPEQQVTMDMEAELREADAQLYTVKKSGKNNFAIAG